MVMNHLRLVPSPTSREESNDSACLEAFQREFDHLCRSLRRLGVLPADVPDFAQEVFLVLRRNWATIDLTRSLSPYLFGIAFRIVSAYQRRHKREFRLEAIEMEDLSPRPDQTLQAKQARNLVLAALARIPGPRRAVLVMHDVDEIAMQDVASALAIPVYTAYSRLRKARQEFETAVRRLQKGTGES
jgi:RNA polymerase sigma-70 factor, ECF subfamily